jgi:hypothetical protein
LSAGSESPSDSCISCTPCANISSVGARGRPLDDEPRAGDDDDRSPLDGGVWLLAPESERRRWKRLAADRLIEPVRLEGRGEPGAAEEDEFLRGEKSGIRTVYRPQDDELR